MCLCARMVDFELKGRAFIEKVNSACFCWFPAAILVDSFCTKLYKGARTVSANNSETVRHKDLRFWQIVYSISLIIFHFLGFYWTVSNFFCAVFIAWQWKEAVHPKSIFMKIMFILIHDLFHDFECLTTQKLIWS